MVTAVGAVGGGGAGRRSPAGRRFPLPAYSEYMPSPYLAPKPYDLRRAAGACTVGASDDAALDISEYEQATELTPGLATIAGHLLTELDRLVRGPPHEFSRTLLTTTPPGPRAGRVCAGAHAEAGEPSPCGSRSPVAHAGRQGERAVDAVRRQSRRSGRGLLAQLRRPSRRRSPRAPRRVGQQGAPGPVRRDGVRIVADAAELPAFARRASPRGGRPLDGVDTLVTFRPFATLPARVRAEYSRAAAARSRTRPAWSSSSTPATASSARALPRAAQIPLLHLFAHLADSARSGSRSRGGSTSSTT